MNEIDSEAIKLSEFLIAVAQNGREYIRIQTSLNYRLLPQPNEICLRS